jgi:hypothetical protein
MISKFTEYFLSKSRHSRSKYRNKSTNTDRDPTIAKNYEIVNEQGGKTSFKLD